MPFVGIMVRDALHPSILMERNPGTPFGPVAQPLSSVADRDLLWRENDPDRLPGILGIYVARAQEPVALPEVDFRNGPLRPSQDKKYLETTRWRQQLNLQASDLLPCLYRFRQSVPQNRDW